MDIIILVTIAIVVIALAWIGFRTSVRPPSDEGGRRTSETRFVLLAFAGICLLVWSGVRSVNVRAQLAAGLHSIDTKLGSFGPRAIAPDARQRVVDYLEAAPGHSKVKVLAVKGDVEAANYADAWLAILRAAGWEPDPTLSYADPAQAVPGIVISVRSADTAGAAVLQQAFAMAGAEATGELNGADDADTIELIVGKKR